MEVNEDNLKLDKITLPELLSKSFNFQNLNDLELAFNKLWDSDFLKFICEEKTGLCGFNCKTINRFSIDSVINDWRTTIEDVFEIRHKVVHDANYRPLFDIPFIQKSEVLFLLIPQLVTYFLTIRYNLKSFVLSDGKQSVHYLFSIHDIIADDWVIRK